MDGKYKSILSLENYIVNEIKFKRNKEYKGEKLNIDFSINKNISYNKDIMIVDLETRVFENPEKNNYPFEMVVKIEGIFKYEGEVKYNLEANAIAILYPFIRAIVANYTAYANVNSLILPIINVNTFIEECEKTEQE